MLSDVINHCRSRRSHGSIYELNCEHVSSDQFIHTCHQVEHAPRSGAGTHKALVGRCLNNISMPCCPQGLAKCVVGVGISTKKLFEVRHIDYCSHQQSDQQANDKETQKKGSFWTSARQNDNGRQSDRRTNSQRTGCLGWSHKYYASRYKQCQKYQCCVHTIFLTSNPLLPIARR